MRALLEIRVLFKGGSYMRKYGMYCDLLTNRNISELVPRIITSMVNERLQFFKA